VTSKLSGFLDSRDFFLEILVLQFVFSIVVFLNIPVATQILGFIDLMFVPGIVFLKLLKLEDLQQLEIVLFSAGFSVAFLMIAGLLLNEAASLVGISRPLTELPLMITLNSVVVLASCFVSSQSRIGGVARVSAQIIESLKLIIHAPLIILFILLPFLSVLGTIWMNAYENNIILLLMIVTVSVLLIICAIREKLLPPKLYPIAIFMIALALLFQSSLISKYIVNNGSDILNEYSVFKATQKMGRWNPVLPQAVSNSLYGRYNDMLSITILPTIFTDLLNIDTVWVFKVLAPIIFSLVPLALYQMWQTRVGTKGALISAFFFMSQQTFYTEMLGLVRQMVAEFFFVLLFLVVLKTKMSGLKKMVCFVTFSTALIVSHYALSAIFLFFISLAWVALIVVRRPSSKMTLTAIALFLVLMFTWYIHTSNSATFGSFLDFGANVYNQLNQWANPTSRGTTVMTGLGMETAPSVLNSISRGFAYLTEFLVIVGFVGMVTRRVKGNVDREYLTFTSLAIILLAALIVVPALANTLNMTRFYHILLFFLAPLALLGAGFLVNLVFKRKTEFLTVILLMIILVPYFLFQTNFLYEVTGSDSWSIPLSMYRMQALRLYGHQGYIDESSALGAQWLSEKVEIENTEVYADVWARGSALAYYDVLFEGDVTVLSNTTKVVANGIIYLDRMNLANGTMVTSHYYWNIFEMHFLNNMSKIYSNGGSEVYINPH
jgi:uncharacterized membrane protein